MAVTDDRIVEFWQKNYAWASDFRRSGGFEDRWLENWSHYRNTRQTMQAQGQGWRSNAQIPDAFRIVETMVPQHVLSMFRNRNWFSVEAPSSPGKTYQLVAKSLLLHGWRKADAYRKTIEGVKLGNILGHFCPKVTWQVRMGEKEVTDIDFQVTADGERVPAGFKRRTVPTIEHNGPQIEIPDLFNLWQDPTGQERWWIERIPNTSFSELEFNNKQFGGRLYKNLAKLKTYVDSDRLGSTGRAGGSHGSIDSIGPLSETVDGIPVQKDEDHVELWQCWGWVNPKIKEYDDTQWRLQIIANQRVLIRDVPIPTWNHKPPYTNVQGIPIPGQIYGDSPLSYVGDLLDLRSQIENMRRDEVLLNIYGTYAIDDRVENVRGQDLFKRPGGALRVMPGPGQSLKDVFIPIPRQPVLQEAYQESAVKEQQALKTSGATEPFQGTNFGGRTTATEVNLIADIGTSRFQLATMWMDETFKKPVLEQMFKLYQARLTTPEVVQLAGQPEVSGEIDFSDLQYDVDVYVDSGLFGSMDQQQLQNIMQAYSVMLQNPETLVYIDPGEFVKRISYRAGITGADDFVRSDEEVAQIQAQQQQQALLQAALSGETAGG